MNRNEQAVCTVTLSITHSIFLLKILSSSLLHAWNIAIWMISFSCLDLKKTLLIFLQTCGERIKVKQDTLVSRDISSSLFLIVNVALWLIRSYPSFKVDLTSVLRGTNEYKRERDRFVELKNTNRLLLSYYVYTKQSHGFLFRTML